MLQLNILVNSSHRAIITDFGSARFKKTHETRSSASLDQPTSTHHGVQGEKEGPQVSLSASNSELTLTGPNWSFRWAAPEILDGEEPDLASDVWALGWIAWEVSWHMITYIARSYYTYVYPLSSVRLSQTTTPFLSSTL